MALIAPRCLVKKYKTILKEYRTDKRANEIFGGDRK
jgi:hypothetical protein